ncbi:hypothetical protein QUC31_002460 [Theobroma cacao]|uniref:Uncharacterized protein DDB_G0271670 n=2 Tax=Theobroma cacao TaxID=3641 RepID=A0AB32WMW6_THECC|nr:PREDICTED: uncharacterized protein DDB_G0271670 [Theobroma cacao]EOY13818.1 Uncharacterized protein TCM_032474 [Theobroma cacao]WRX29275.1 hypothetical protein QQP08_021762 [Theobroma cacao]
MASACVNNIGVSPESFQPTTSYSSYGWLSPRMSFSREEESSKSRPKSPTDTSSADPLPASDPPEIQDNPAGDFEFRLEDPVTMLPADELFSDGKLVPLHFSTVKQRPPVNVLSEIRSPETAKSCRRIEMEISGTDPYLFSPKAPRCSSRWRELLGLKKFSQITNQPPKSESQSKISLLSNNNSKSLKHFLHRSSKSSSSSSSTASWADSSLSLPLLKDSDCESVSISSSRLSLSSSSSGHEHEDLPRLSLDSDKPSLNNPSPNPFAPCRSINPNPPRMRMVKPRPGSGSDSNQKAAGGTRMGRSPIRSRDSSGGVTSRGVSVDSPRMNSSGKIVFQSLERSSSSPSSFNGGPRFKQRGMERSYSANVRITPVLNVPVCSLRGSSKSGSVFGFGQLFSSSPQKSANGGSSKGHQSNSSSRNKTSDRNH